jgi:hypothetical protein
MDNRKLTAGAALAAIAGLADTPSPMGRHFPPRGPRQAELLSHGTLPDDGRRFGGQTFWRTAAMKRDLDAWLRRQAAGRTMITKDMPPLVLSRVLAAQAKRSRKAMVLKARGHL